MPIERLKGNGVMGGTDPPEFIEQDVGSVTYVAWFCLQDVEKISKVNQDLIQLWCLS
jgi:hypothetical protein